MGEGAIAAGLEYIDYGDGSGRRAVRVAAMGDQRRFQKGAERAGEQGSSLGGWDGDGG